MIKIVNLSIVVIFFPIFLKLNRNLDRNPNHKAAVARALSPWRVEGEAAAGQGLLTATCFAESAMTDATVKEELRQLEVALHNQVRVALAHPAYS